MYPRHPSTFELPKKCLWKALVMFTHITGCVWYNNNNMKWVVSLWKKKLCAESLQPLFFYLDPSRRFPNITKQLMLLNIPHYRAAVSTETLYLYVVLVPPLDIPHSFPCVDVASQKSLPITPKFDHSKDHSKDFEDKNFQWNLTRW